MIRIAVLDANKLADAVRTVHSGQLALTAELMTLINDDPPEPSTQELHVLISLWHRQHTRFGW